MSVLTKLFLLSILLRLSNTLSLNLGKSQCGDEASCCCGAWLVDNVHGILRHFFRNSQSCNTRENQLFMVASFCFCFSCLQFYFILARTFLISLLASLFMICLYMICLYMICLYMICWNKKNSLQRISPNQS